MSEIIVDYPVVSIDTHFRSIPGFQSIDVDPQKYAVMLMDLGVPAERAGSNNNIYIRPDYGIAYSRWERARAFLKHPFDYTDAASCVENNQGGVDIVLVYGSGYGLNELLRHESHHAVPKLAPNGSMGGLLTGLRYALDARKSARQEEEDADKLMHDKRFKSAYGKIIKVSVAKRPHV